MQEIVRENGAAERKDVETQLDGAFTLGLLSAGLSSPSMGPSNSLTSKVDLASDFQGVDPPASFVVLPLPSVARLLIVPASVDVLGEHIHAEDSV